MSLTTNLKDSEVPSVKAELLLPAYAGMTSAQKAVELSKTKQVANPMPPPPEVPIPLTGTRLFELLQRHVAPANFAKMVQKREGDLMAIAGVAERGDATAVTTWGKVLVAKTDMSQAELTAIVTSLKTETQPDPNYKATVPTNRLTEVTGRRNGGIADWEIDIVEAS